MDAALLLARCLQHVQQRLLCHCWTPGRARAIQVIPFHTPAVFAQQTSVAKGKFLSSPGDSENFQYLLPSPKPPGKIFVISEDLDQRYEGRNDNHAISSDQYLPNLNAVWKHLQCFAPGFSWPAWLRAGVRSSR